MPPSIRNNQSQYKLERSSNPIEHKWELAKTKIQDLAEAILIIVHIKMFHVSNNINLLDSCLEEKINER